MQTDAASKGNIGIWIRVSTEDQVRGDSPEHHEQRGRLYAAAQGYTVTEVYRLDAVSGKSVMDNPETRRMLADVRDNRIKGLIFSKLARLARNTRELLDFADIFRKHDAALISLQESLDTGTPAGRFFYTVIGALAEWERGEIADRVAASVVIRAKLGKPLGGRAPYGYQWVEKRMVPNPDEAPVRKLIYELYAQLRRKKAVVNELTKRGYRTRVGKPFTAMAVEELIRDTTAKGLYRSNYSSRRNGRYEVKPESEWIMTPVEPIVSEDLWESCNRTLMARKTGGPFPGPRPEHLFGGKVRCECGGKMYARLRSGKYGCQNCAIKIPAKDLEDIYHSQLTGFLFSDSEIDEALGRASKAVAEKEGLIRRLQDDEVRIQRELDKLFDLHSAGEIPTAGFGLKYRPLEDRLTQIGTEILELQVAIDVSRINAINSDHMLAEARALHRRWPSLTHEEKRDIVQAITDEIIVGKEAIDIRLEYLPDLGTSANKGTYQVGYVPFLPATPVSLQGRRRLTITPPLVTLGDHLRFKRSELGLTQRQMAARFNVVRDAYARWEGGTANPSVELVPVILKLLGYDPRPVATEFGDILIRTREGLGLRQEPFACLLRVPVPTLRAWERKLYTTSAARMRRVMSRITVLQFGAPTLSPPAGSAGTEARSSNHFANKGPPL